MASITKIGKGKQPPRAIDFIDDTDGRRRKRVRLGVVTHGEAAEAKRRIEKLLTAKILNQPPDQETASWLNGVSDTIHDRIARAGLAEPRQAPPTAPQLGDFLEKYIAQRRSELKPASLERIEQNWRAAEDALRREYVHRRDHPRRGGGLAVQHDRRGSE